MLVHRRGHTCWYIVVVCADYKNFQKFPPSLSIVSGHLEPGQWSVLFLGIGRWLVVARAPT